MRNSGQWPLRPTTVTGADELGVPGFNMLCRTFSSIFAYFRGYLKLLHYQDIVSVLWDWNLNKPYGGEVLGLGSLQYHLQKTATN